MGAVMNETAEPTQEAVADDGLEAELPPARPPIEWPAWTRSTSNRPTSNETTSVGISTQIAQIYLTRGLHRLPAGRATTIGRPGAARRNARQLDT